VAHGTQGELNRLWLEATNHGNAESNYMCIYRQIFDSMRKEGCLPNDVTYATVIAACWKGNEWRKAVELLKMMHSNDLSVSMMTVSMVIDVCDRNKQHDLAVSQSKPRLVMMLPRTFHPV